ncbi:hypothetical protein DSL72_003616 [Monilinia vaccinii-corymbosi]|uniref:Uncharacterized protein n=1 Tax=Monilinia vaccinii-corymbosi TaxID=61207 RepID=A0A8A3P1R2_9HELO|nr:hypothetical protein DSL72_003616 [Monilinia vaccinii-corymbosi]
MPILNMPMLRNPFARRQDVQAGLQPSSQDDQDVSPRPSFERVSTVASQAPSSISIKAAKSEEPLEYKMSVVNDSGVYLPVCIENLTIANATTTTDQFRSPRHPKRKASGLAARAIFLQPQSMPEGPRMMRLTRFQSQENHSIHIEDHLIYQLDHLSVPSMDIAGDRVLILQDYLECNSPPSGRDGLNDGANDFTKQIKKKGFFSKFSDEALPSFHMPGRKRGQSGTGEELGNIPKPDHAIPKAEVNEVR